LKTIYLFDIPWRGSSLFTGMLFAAKQVLKPLAMKTVILFSQAVLLCMPFISKTYAQQSEFDLGLTNQVKLLPLQCEISEDAIAAAYMPRERILSQSGSPDESELEYASDLLTTDARTRDAAILAERFISRDLVSAGSENYGTLEFRLLYYEHKKTSSILAAFNTLTFGIGYLLGVPSVRNLTRVEVELSLYDAEGIWLASYPGIGEDKYFQGLYTRKDERASNRDAIRDALLKINTGIMAEIGSINARLLGSGSF